MSTNISKLSGRKGLGNSLFERIIAFDQKADVEKSIDDIAKEFFVGKSTIASSTSFYDFLSEQHQNKSAYVCNGTACLCAGTQDTVKEMLGKQLGSENIGHITCLGRCHENSAFQLNGANYSGEAINNLDAIVAQQDSHHLDHYSVMSCGPALLTAPYVAADFRKQLDSVLKLSPESLIDEIKKSNLKGRGGAGFPTGIKWESCKNADGLEKTIICNGDEGDPGAYSDRYLLEQQLYRVVFGMVVAAYIVGAEHGVIYIRAEYPEAIANCEQTIRQLLAGSYLGNNIGGSSFCFQLTVVKGAGAYICGEETALIASIEGRRPEVDIRPPFPTTEGLFKKPTVLNNVETFAAIPAILEEGGEAFSVIGSEQSSGTKLICLDGMFNRPGLLEVPMGTPLSHVVDTMGGGFTRPVKAMQIGGPLGGLVPVSEISNLAIDFETFSKHGFLLGHGSVVCIPEDFSIAKLICHLFEFTANESCGKCFPCRLGSTRGKEMWQRSIDKKNRVNRELLQDLLDTLEKGSLCALGGGLPLPIRNALQYFSGELEEYMTNG